MSASRWPNESRPPPNGDSPEFSEANEPMLAFPQVQTGSSLEFNAPQSQQFQQRVQSSKLVDGSPAALNAMYHTSNTIPSKRSRPIDDTMGGSPQAFPVSVPLSRSQTPQGNYPGFHGPMNGGLVQTHAGYQHPSQSATPKQHSSTHNPQSVASNGHHRVQTVSPSPFSPAAPQYGHQASPSHSEDGSRVATPQHTTNMQANSHYGMGAGQSYGAQPIPAMNGTPHPQYPQGSQNDQMIFEARLRQMNQMAAVRGTQQPQAAPFSPALQVPHQMTNMQMAQLRAQQGHQGGLRQTQSQHILNSIIQFTRMKRIPFNPNPSIAGKGLNSVSLFFGVVKLGGSGRIAQSQQWPHVASLLGYPPHLVGIAGQELQNFWQTSLAEYERHWYQSQHNQRQRFTAETMRAAGNTHQGEPNPRSAYYPSGRPMTDHGGNFMQATPSTHVGQQSPLKQNSEMHTAPNGLNDGVALPSPPTPSNHHNMRTSLAPERRVNEIVQTEHRNAKRLHVKNSQTSGAETWANRKRDLPEMFIPRAFSLELPPLQIQDDENGEAGAVEDQKGRWLTSHGGLPVDDIDFRGSVASLLNYKARVASLDELEAVDIRAITMCLRSGISGEIRHALDTVMLLSEQPRIYLDQCDELVEALVECANDQVDFLAGHATEVSDIMLINAYEDTIRGCKAELEEIQEPARFGTLEHELQTAVERLTCVTAIFRNSAMFEGSHRALSDPIVLRMMVNVMRYLGTRNMMLRSHQNALDYAKDAVVFLSQIAHRLDLHDKDEALGTLHFLLSFAPLPDPCHAQHDNILFTPYVSSRHPYLPNAVNAFAKLLVRENNRVLYRSIFQQEACSSQPSELLTRTFAFAVSPVPEANVSTSLERTTVRIPFIAQGLLVAETLIAMIPNTEHALASSWLHSYDEFGSRLMKLVSSLPHHLLTHHTSHQQHPHVRPPVEEVSDPYGHVMVTHRGLIILKKLIEKSKTVDSGSFAARRTFPSLRTVLSVLEDSRTDLEISRLFCVLRDLDSSNCASR